MTIRTLALAVGLLAVAATPGAAQVSMGSGGGKESSPVQKQYEQRLKEQAEIDRQYRATNRNTAGAESPKVVNDPWANVRPAAPEKRPQR